MPPSIFAFRRGSQLVFRILFSLIFVASGAKHLLSPDAVVNRLLAAPGAFLVDALAPKLRSK